MKSERYTTIAGETIEYTVSPEVSTFLARLVTASNDPRVGEGELIELLYGKENPLLDQSVLPHHGVVTRAVFEDPVYHVMTDLLGRKRVQLGRLDLPKAHAEYTMTVAEAAKKLDVHQTSIRVAIRARKLDAIKQGGVLLLRPSSVESYRVSRRGPKPRVELHPEEDPTGTSLEVCVGSAPGESAKIQVLGNELEVQRKEAGKVFGLVRDFARVYLLAGGKGKHRFFDLEAADQPSELKLGSFFVRGGFRVANKVNNPKDAEETWRTMTSRYEVATKAFDAGKLGPINVIVNASGSSFSEVAYWSVSPNELRVSCEALAQIPATVVHKIESLLAEKGIDVDSSTIQLRMSAAQTRVLSGLAHVRVQRQLAGE